MGKRKKYRDDIDPEYQRWARKYPRFPGVAECARLIRAQKARGAWADIIASELAKNASDHLPDLVEVFRTDPSDDVRLHVMIALEMAELPESVRFLGEVLREGNPRHAPYAERALRAINTADVRDALRNAGDD